MSNPFKRRLRRWLRYLTGPAASQLIAFLTWALGFEPVSPRGYSHSTQCVSWAGAKSQYERVEQPAMALSSLRGQEGFVAGQDTRKS
jgi:hypothetical protein